MPHYGEFDPAAFLPVYEDHAAIAEAAAQSQTPRSPAIQEAIDALGAAMRDSATSPANRAAAEHAIGQLLARVVQEQIASNN